VKRRTFIAALGSAAVWPAVALAQQDRVRHLGWLAVRSQDDPEQRATATALTTKLETLGWRLGQNLIIDVRNGMGNAELLRQAAAELVSKAPDVILTASVQNVRTLRDLTRTIPIVFAGASDPVAVGLVESYAHPGGNVTGFTGNAETKYESDAKLLEILKEIVPNINRTAVIFTTADPSWVGRMRALEVAASSLKVQLSPIDVHDDGGLDDAIDRFSQEPNSGLLVLPSSFTSAHYVSIIRAANLHMLPTVYPFRFFVTHGGLVSYGTDIMDGYRQSAVYIDRILRGERPGALPVQALTKLDLVLNLKTAKALGLSVPPQLLARADEVIE
jgi:putative ABC transport system substrate-binding protein